MFEVPEILATLAELCLGLAGFSGVVLVWGGKPEAMHAFDNFRMRILVYMSLGGMGMATIPYLLELALPVGPGFWRIACAFNASYYVFLALICGHDIFALDPDGRSEILAVPGGWAWAVIIALTGTVTTFAQCAVVFGAFERFSPFLFAVGVAWLLGMAAYLFGTLLFVRPGDGR